MSAIRKTPDTLIRIQRKIYASLKAEVTRLMGPTPPSILTYEKAYRRAFHKLLKRPSLSQATLSQEAFLTELRDTPFIFVGDFHTDPQSQKTALRLLRKLRENDPQSEWFLGLEMIPSHYQRWIDRYLSDEITEQRFLSAIRYREEWGFPWENYAPLFAWARAAKIPVLALNRPRALALKYHGSEHDPTQDLRARDQWAAGVLMDRWSVEPRRRRFLVLYGEMHVAAPHLPTALLKIARALGFGRGKLPSLPKTASVFSGFDALYFKWAELGKDSSSEILKIGPQTYCLMTTTPWGKLQSAINWLEGGGRDPQSSASPEDDDEDADDSRDETGQVAEPLRWLCDFFRLPVPPLDALQLVTIRNADQMESRLGRPQLTQFERSALRYHWLHNQRVYCAPLTLAYLGSPSFNTYAEMAALHLLMSVRRRKRMLPEGPAGFYELIIDSCFGFLGSLLLNPKRKCDLARDHQKRLAALKDGTATALFPEEIGMRELTLQTLKRMDNPRGPELYVSKRIGERMTSILACRQVGKVLAKALYPAVREGKVTPAQLVALFLERDQASSDSRAVCEWLATKIHTQSRQTKAEHF